MTAASYRTILGVAKQTTSGTPVVPTNFLPVTSPKLTTKPTYIQDKAWRGSMVESYDQIPGVVHGELDFGGPVMADTFPFLLQSLLPDITTTGSAAPYSHALAALNSGNGQPGLLTITDYDGVQTLQYPDVKISDLSLKFTADGLVEYTAKGMSLAPITGSLPTPSYSALRSTAGWAGAFSIGGTQRTAATGNVLLDAQLDIKRNVTVQDGLTGTATPIFIWAGPVSVAVKITAVYDDTTDYENMVNNSQPALLVNFSAGSGATATQLEFQMSKCAFTAAEVDRSGDYGKLSITGDARANTTDVGASGGYSPLLATIQNAMASGSY